MSKCKTSCRYKVYDPCSYIHEVKHVILQNPVSIQSLRSTLLYTRRDACDTRQKRTDRCNSNNLSSSNFPSIIHCPVAYIQGHHAQPDLHSLAASCQRGRNGRYSQERPQ